MSCHCGSSLVARNSCSRPTQTSEKCLDSFFERVANLKKEIERYESFEDLGDHALSERVLACHELDEDSLCSVCRQFIRDNDFDTVEIEKIKVCHTKEGSSSWLTLPSRVSVQSTTLFKRGEDEWVQQDSEILRSSQHLQNAVSEFKRQTRESVNRILSVSDDNEELVLQNLKRKNQEIYGLKLEFETEITLMDDEIQNLEKSKRRLNSAIEALMRPESTVKECLEKRSVNSARYELVRDQVGDELTIQLALIGEVQALYQRVLKEVEIQLDDDKTMKKKLEKEWSNKKETNEIESFSLTLDNRSRNVIFTPGALNMPSRQATADFWEQQTKDIILEARRVRCRSANIRAILKELLAGSNKDLQNQKLKISMVLDKKIKSSSDLVKRVEMELDKTLKQLSDADELKLEIESAIRRLSYPIKKATTRLSYSRNRPGVDNCTDDVFYGLVTECRSADVNLASLKCHWDEIQNVQTTLQEARSKLEKELRLRQKNLDIDYECSGLMAQFFGTISILQAADENGGK